MPFGSESTKQFSCKKNLYRIYLVRYCLPPSKRLSDLSEHQECLHARPHFPGHQCSCVFAVGIKHYFADLPSGLFSALQVFTKVLALRVSPF